MTEVRINHAEFIRGLNDATLIPVVDIDKGHALMKTSLAPTSWRVLIQFGTYVSIMLIPCAIVLFFFIKWWIPLLMILLGIYLTKLIRSQSQKAVIDQSILNRQFYELAISTETLRIYRKSNQSVAESGNTITGIVTKGLHAESIVNDYMESLAMGSRGIARPISYLKNTKEEIRQAFKDYMTALILQHKLDGKLATQLRATYSSIDHFIDDKLAHDINRIEGLRKSKQPISADEETLHRWFVVDVLMNSTSKANEFDNLLK